MKLFYPILLLMAFCLHAAAQSTGQTDKSARQEALSLKRAEARARDSIALERYTHARMAAKLNLFNLFDPEAPTILAGIEYRLGRRVLAEFTVGIPVRIHGNVRHTDSTYNNYYKLKFELRYFPFERQSFYLAPELTYISKERSKYNDKYDAKNGDTYQYDFAEIDKSIVAFALKIGVVTPLRKNNRWLFDLFFGAGPRFINMKMISIVNPQPGGRGFDFDVSKDREGSTTTVHLTGGVKVGYIIF